MKSIILLALFCFATVGFELALARHSNLHEWEQYKRQHGKVYETPEEDSSRFSLFLAAKERVAQHNANDQASYKMSLNHLSDWTPEESAMLNGFRHDSLEPAKLIKTSNQRQYLKALKRASNVTIPDEIDWRKVPNRVTAVKDQGKCASDWAFATTGTLEGQMVNTEAKRKQLVPLSEQQLIDCSKLNRGCHGGNMAIALDYISSVGGIESEKNYPYIGTDNETCKSDKSKFVMTADGADERDDTEDQLKFTVAIVGPVATALRANDNLKHYKSGIFTDPNCGFHLDHAVLIVGYGTDPTVGEYWIVKNSWSSSWGENGYFRIKRGDCGIGNLFVVPWRPQ
uniref:Cathepsin L n=1 Tax=Aceria tosichella TaxID=561515 RepID=A0A6G1SNZ3_9ACAR